MHINLYCRAAQYTSYPELRSKSNSGVALVEKLLPRMHIGATIVHFTLDVY